MSDELEQLRERTEHAEAVMAEAREALLDQAAYDSTAFDPATADVLLSNGGGERLEAYVDAFPQEAAAWAADREQMLARRAAQEHVTKSQAALEAELGRRQEIADTFSSRHNDPYAEAIVRGALGAQVPTEELAESLEQLHRGLAEADRAAARAEAVREAKSAFTDPSVVGVQALDRKTGDRRPALPETTEADVAERINWEPPAMKEARKLAADAEFRQAWADEARPKFMSGPQGREDS